MALALARTLGWPVKAHAWPSGRASGIIAATAWSAARVARLIDLLLYIRLVQDGYCSKSFLQLDRRRRLGMRLFSQRITRRKSCLSSASFRATTRPRTFKMIAAPRDSTNGPNHRSASMPTSASGNSSS